MNLKHSVTFDMRDPSSLLAYENNARTHSDEQIAQLVDSITAFGFNDPIEIDPRGTIISGHARAQAAVRAGLKQVPVITLQGMDENARKAYILAANRIALNAGWDADLLKIEFEELLANDFDITLTGFDEDEIEKFLNTTESQQPAKDLSDSLETRYIVEISCINEIEQEKMYNEIKKRGFECRILTL